MGKATISAKRHMEMEKSESGGSKGRLRNVIREEKKAKNIRPRKHRKTDVATEDTKKRRKQNG